MEKMRGFLVACAIVAAAVVLAEEDGEEEEKQGVRLLDAGRLEKFVDELPDMPVLRGYGVGEGGQLVPGELGVGMYDTTWKFHRDLPLFAYGTSKETATVPGPTIAATRGVPTRVTWTNHLPPRHLLPWDRSLATPRPHTGVPTVVHLHGGVQQSTSDGHGMAWFTSAFASTGPHGAVGDRGRRRRLRPDGENRRRGAAAVRRPGAVPRGPRREGGHGGGDEVRGGDAAGARPVDRAGGADAAVPEARRAGGGADAADRHVRVHQERHRRADAPVPERAGVHGPGDGDAAGGDLGAVGGDQPHRRQPPAARAPGGLRGPGAAVAAPRQPVQGVHEGQRQRRRRGSERRGGVRDPPAPRRRAEARRAKAGARVEERVQGAARHGGHAARALQAAGGG